jgi:hypothetical protein
MSLSHRSIPRSHRSIPRSAPPTVSVRTPPPNCWSPLAPTRTGSAARPRWPRCAEWLLSRHPRAKSPATDSPAAATGQPTMPLYRIALVRMSAHQQTRDYVQRATNSPEAIAAAAELSRYFESTTSPRMTTRGSLVRPPGTESSTLLYHTEPIHLMHHRRDICMLESLSANGGESTQHIQRYLVRTSLDHEMHCSTAW